MRRPRALAGIAALGVLFCAASAEAAPAPTAPALYAGATALRNELALLGRDSSTLGLPQGRALSELTFKSNDGYAFSVVAFGQTVAIRVTRDHGGQARLASKNFAAATYVVHGRVTASSIQASFGDRGRIAVRFHPSGRLVRAGPRTGCGKSKGGAVIARLGVFAGELSFQGEGGYASADVHRARGRSIDFAALLACLFRTSGTGRQVTLPPPRLPIDLHASGVPTHPSDRPKRTTLIAEHKLPLSRTLFGAQVRDQGRTRFVAVSQSSEGSIGIIRLVSVRGPESAFTFESSLAGATVVPPAPFSGRGTLERGLGGTKAWTGSLAVSFLGAPRVPLADPLFSTQLVRGW